MHENYLFDLTKEESIERLYEVALKPDLIIACAGVAINGKAESYTKEDKQESYYLMCGWSYRYDSIISTSFR